MNKRILATLMAATVTSVICAASKPDTMTLTERRALDEVQVVSVKTRLAPEHLRVVSVISAEQIRSIPAGSVSELLENLPGLDVRTRGTGGVQADLSMRGGTFDQVVVLLNGVNITDPQTGHYTMDIPVDVSMIDRIEVLQGTSISIFGLSAFSGAINIITGSTTTDHTTATLSGGDHGLINAALGANYGVGQWRLLGSASYNRSEGYMPNSDYQYSNLMLQATCDDTLTGHWNLQLGAQVKDYGANVFYSLAYPNQYEQTRTLLGSLSWERRISRFSLAASLYHRTHFDHYELIRDYIDAPDWYTFHNNHLTTVSGANIKGAWHSSVGKTSVGVELRNEHILSNVLGDPLTSPIQVPCQDTATNYLYGKNRLNVNYFAEQTLYFGHFSGSVGFSGNWNTMFAHNFAFGVNAGYEYLPGGHIFASLHRALRLPSFTDLYYHSATQESNPALRPETSLTSELGISYTGHGVTTRLNAYYRLGRNIIDWIKLPDETIWHATNHTAVDALGGEISIAYTHGYWLPKAQLTYSFCHLMQDAGDYMSRYALDYLRHKLTLNLEHGIYRGFGASWQLSFQSRNGTYNDRNGDTQTYRPVWLLDGQIFWQGDKIRLYIEATNITDRHYYDYGGILQPGIWARGGIKVTI